MTIFPPQTAQKRARRSGVERPGRERPFGLPSFVLA